MANVELPEHLSLGGLRHTNPQQDLDEMQTRLARRNAARLNAKWLARPSVVSWAGACNMRSPSVAHHNIDKQHEQALEDMREQERKSGRAREGKGAREGGEEAGEREAYEQALEVMRQDAARELRKIAAHFGAENADALAVEELYPRLDDKGDVVLPKWIKWEDLQEMGVGDTDRDVLALMFSRRLNSDPKHLNMTVAAAQNLVDSHEPLPFNWDGQPWVYDRPASAKPLGLSLRQDPWNTASPSIRSIVSHHQQLLGGALERAVSTGNRRRSFKLMMVGPDGGGKTSLLFCWKANQPLDDANLETVPTVYDCNVEEVAYKDLVFVCWDIGGPDDFRAYVPPTADAASVDAIVFVVDAIRMRADAAYRVQAKKELWRHLEGDILNADIMAAEDQLRQSLVDNQGPEDPEQPWVPLQLGDREMLEGPVPDDMDDVHYLPISRNHTMLHRDGSTSQKPVDTGLWLRHVRKILVIANKCEATDRASLSEIASALDLEKIKTTRLNSAERCCTF